MTVKNKKYKKSKIKQHVQHHESSDEEAYMDYIQNIYVDESELNNVLDENKKSLLLLQDNQILPCEEKQYKPLVDDLNQYKFLLPIKKDGQIIPIYESFKVDEKQMNDEFKADRIRFKREKLSFKNLEELKLYIADTLSFILESPEENLPKLSKIINMVTNSQMYNIQETDSVIAQSYLVYSVKELFLDLIPSYKIRISTQEEKQQLMSKETRALRNFEENLIKCYKKYIDGMISILRNKNSRSISKIPLIKTVIKSVGDLLIMKPNFNFTSELIKSLTPLLNHQNVQISNNVFDIFKQIFISDSSNHVSLLLVKAINQFIKKCKYKIKPQVIDVFLWLKLEDINAHISKQMENTPDKDSKINSSNKQNSVDKRSKKFLSRKHFKKAKAMEKFKRDLDLTSAINYKSDKHSIDTEITNILFTIYFKILRNSVISTTADSAGDKKPPSTTYRRLLSSVLKGLATFALIINVEFFHDLLETLNQLSIAKLTDVSDKLHSIIAAFTILGGQHQSTFNIDMNRFYASFYNTLLPPPIHHFDLTQSQSHDELADPKILSFSLLETQLIARCLELCFIQRRANFTTLEQARRVSAFIKRLALIALSTVPKDITQATTNQIFILLTLKLLQTFPSTLHLLNTDTDEKAPGMDLFNCYIPESNDPDFCQAQNAILWEFSTLKTRYYDSASSLTSNIMRDFIGKIKPMTENMNDYANNTITSLLVDKQYNKLLNARDLKDLQDATMFDQIYAEKHCANKIDHSVFSDANSLETVSAKRKLATYQRNLKKCLKKYSHTV